MGYHSLLQGIFPTQGSNPGLPYCRQILYHRATGESVLCIKHHAVCKRPHVFPLICTEYDCRCLVTQSCLTLCDPTGCSQLSSSVHGILQARILEWIAPFPSPGELPNSGIEPASPALADRFFTAALPRKPHRICCKCAYSILQIRGNEST